MTLPETRKMRTSLALVLTAAIASYAPMALAKGSSRVSYGGGHHTSSHGGTYKGGQGSSHRGGEYKNTRTSNSYGKHK